MKNYLLVINCGSSSLKFGLFNSVTMDLVSEGLAEKLNGDEAELHIRFEDEKKSISLREPGHSKAINVLSQELEHHYQLSSSLVGIGHRVVHGGERFKSSMRIDEGVINEIRDCIPLAPLHNPANLLGIELMQTEFSDLPQVAVFDTSFHQTMPEQAFLYALPYKFYRDLNIRRYGFHGTSHRFVSAQAAEHLNKPLDKLNVISAHLGNGASVSAIKSGKSVDTSMGLTPLEGLVMGTRCGDLDPGIYDYLLAQGFSAEDISRILNKESGLLGISEKSNDMRTLSELADQGDKQAAIAIDIFCFRLAKYIAAMMTSLDEIDGLIFTGGIGENATNIRKKTVSRLSLLGFKIDQAKNEGLRKANSPFINKDGTCPIVVIPTNEELMIAKDTLALL